MSELAEGARLEIACATKSGTEGSNPSLSAIKIKINLSMIYCPAACAAGSFILMINAPANKDPGPEGQVLSCRTK